MLDGKAYFAEFPDEDPARTKNRSSFTARRLSRRCARWKRSCVLYPEADGNRREADDPPL